MDLMPNVHFDKSEVIFEEGHPAEAVYLVCEGGVEVFKKKNNEQVSLAKLEKDAIFGEMAFISESPRSATVISTGDTWCYAINKETFLQKLSTIDKEIADIFHDLVDAVKEKSNNAVLIDHGIVEPLDELQLAEQSSRASKAIPRYSYDHLMNDAELHVKVDQMDFFMRKLYKNLVNIAYR
jgi:CRP-like cAMP-binding protein